MSNNQQIILFRVDGSNVIGYGHVFRCIALAQMLSADFECIFVTRIFDEFIKKTLENEGFEYKELSEGDSHFEEFLKVLTGTEIVVLDNYFFDTNYQKAIKKTGAKLVCIDDIHNKYYAADVVINHAPLQLDAFNTAIYSKLCVGFEYAMLRKEFFENHRERVSSSFSHVFICFGGADVNNLTSLTLESVAQITQIKNIDIVLGGAFKHEDELSKVIEKYQKVCNVSIYKNIDSRSIIGLLGNTDFAIVPCSTILFEVISQGIPAIVGYYVDNQVEFAKSIKGNYDSLVMIGDFNIKPITELHIQMLQEQIHNKSLRPIIDKNIPTRYVNAFYNLNVEFSLTVRKAEFKDVNLYFDWANDSIVRKNAISTELIVYDNHVKWFTKRISDKNSLLLIISNETSPIGQVRFDMESQHIIIDYSICKQYRGKGLGSIMLKMALEQLTKTELISDAKYIIGKVKVENISSSKVFKKLSFLEKEREVIDNTVYLVFEKRIIH